MPSRSASSISRITGSVALMASSSGRASRNSSVKTTASGQPPARPAMMRSSCLEWFHSYSALASSRPS